MFITVSGPRLITHHTVLITAESEAELVDRESGMSGYEYRALVVDGRPYDLIRVTHLLAAPEAADACERALATVRAEIAALATEAEIARMQTVRARQYATRTETRKQIVIAWFDGAHEAGRTYYRRDNVAAVERKLAKLAARGYTLRQA